jgi:heptosyltransferase-2
MFSRLYRHSSVKNILVINLSNIGDVVLTSPAMDIVIRDFPNAAFSIVTGPKPASLFEGNLRIQKIHIFDKHQCLWDQVKWVWELRKYHYDLIVDFRNTAIGLLLCPKWGTWPMIFPDKRSHLKDQHLSRLKDLYDFDPRSAPAAVLLPSPEDERVVENSLKSFLGNDDFFVAIAPKAADKDKTWMKEGFVELCRGLHQNFGVKIALIGSNEDRPLIDFIKHESKAPLLNLGGCLNLIQSVALLKRAGIAIVHDSGPMHMASYYNRPIVALFGHTDPEFSRPWSSLYRVIRKNKDCERCHDHKSAVGHQCMQAIHPADVLKAFGEIYAQVK